MTVGNASKFSVEVASVPDREGVVAEVWLGDQLLAELRLEAEVVRIQLYSPNGSPDGPPDGAPHWDVPCDELLAALQTARARLVAGPPASPIR